MKAAEKWVRQTGKRTQRNLDTKTRLKTLYKKAVGAQEDATTRFVESEFDRAAKKGAIHPNKAARKKSRLAKALRTATAAPVKTAKPAKAAKSKTTKTKK